jgi:hypothetical protein
MVQVNSDTPIMVETVRGRFSATLGTFCRDNADAIDHRRRVLIVQTLTAGRPYLGGGGAEAPWTLRRADREAA